MLNRFLVISESINFAAYLSKWRVKTKILRARAKSQLNLLKVTVTSNFFLMVTVTQLLLQSNLPTTASVQAYPYLVLTNWQIVRW